MVAVMKRPAREQVRPKIRDGKLKRKATTRVPKAPSMKKRPSAGPATMKARLQAIMVLPESLGVKIATCLNILTTADGDIFDLLEPHLKSLDPNAKSWESRMFIRFSRMTEKKLNKTIHSDAAEWNLNEKALLKLPFEVRRGAFFHVQFKGCHDYIQEHGIPKKPSEEDDSCDSESSSGDEDEDDTESENEADRHRRIQRMPPGKPKAMEMINDQLIKKGLFIIMLEPPYKRSDSVASIKLTNVLKRDHLLLPLEVGQRACRLSHKMRRLVLSWMDGGTSLGNELWDRYIHPVSKAAASHVRSGQFRPALAEMLGLLLFMDGNDDDWLRDQEEYCDWSRFSGFFSSLSSTWKRLLEQNSSVLGLVPRTGKKGGYRKRIETMLAKWEKETNATLHEVFDDHTPGRSRSSSKRPARNARVKIF